MPSFLRLGSLFPFCLLFFAACQSPAPEAGASALLPTLPADSLPPAPPPMPRIDYDTLLWADMAIVAPDVLLDIRYAGVDNFVGTVMYECGRCLLRPEVAEALGQLQGRLRARGLGLKLFDCYRPSPVQQRLWDKVPDARYVTPPSRGSAHSRGAAVDLTLVDSLGRELPMGTPYDFFGREAYHAYTGLPDNMLANRRLLRESMEAAGFRAIRTEWWHYSYRRRSYPLSDWLWPCGGQ